MPTQKILYIDMDDVLCDYTSALEFTKEQHPDVEFPQSVPGFFENLKPMNNAVNSFLELARNFDWDSNSPII